MPYYSCMKKNFYLILLYCVAITGCATPYREFDAIKAHSMSKTENSNAQPLPNSVDVAKHVYAPAPIKGNEATDIIPSAVEAKTNTLKSESLPPPKTGGKTVFYKAASTESVQPAATLKTTTSIAVTSVISPTQLTTISGGDVVVARQETLFGVSRRTGVSVADLASYNNLELPYTLLPGQKLHWPTLRYHRVVVGETAVSIAHHYGLALAELTESNGITLPIVVRVGQILRLPDKQVISTVSSVSAPSSISKTVVKKPKIAVDTPQPPKITLPENTTIPEPVVEKPAVVATGPAPQFVWPLPGRILSGYGNKGSGRFNDGINIAATRGEPVKAAADGTVVYASQLRGFGWLVLIKHHANWVTTYAHNDSVLVVKGTSVHRGESIARAGSTGMVNTPQLHFEIRRGTRAVDPMLQLPERNISAQDNVRDYAEMHQ